MKATKVNHEPHLLLLLLFQNALSDMDILTAFLRVVLPMAYQFNPQLVFVKADDSLTGKENELIYCLFYCWDFQVTKAVFEFIMYV